MPNLQWAGWIVSFLALLVSAGVLNYAARARQALQHSELDQRYATKENVTQLLDSMRKEVTGARQAIRRDLVELEKRVERADAQAALAVNNADTALSQAQETRALLERYYERIMDDFARPMDKLTQVLGDLSKNVAAQGATLDIILRRNDQ